MAERADESRILVEVRADDLDGGYVASVVGLPGCASQGETVGDALRNIAEAYEGVRDTLAALDAEHLLGSCYAEHDPPRPAVELLRLHLPGRPTREVAACEACARVLRAAAL